MNRALPALPLAGVGVALFLGVDYLREYEQLRAPWTGIMSVAAGVALIAAGVIGRGWLAVVLAAIMAGLGVLVAIDPWQPEPAYLARLPESCDPGCISAEFAVASASTLAAALTTLGIIARKLAAKSKPGKEEGGDVCFSTRAAR